MQNVCVGEKHARFFQYNNSDLLHEVNKVIDANENNLVIYIKNVMKKNLINKFAPFHAYEGTEDVDFAKELHIEARKVWLLLVVLGMFASKFLALLFHNLKNSFRVLSICVQYSGLFSISGSDVMVSKMLLNTWMRNNNSEIRS